MKLLGNCLMNVLKYEYTIVFVFLVKFLKDNIFLPNSDIILSCYYMSGTMLKVIYMYYSPHQFSNRETESLYSGIK